MFPKISFPLCMVHLVLRQDSEVVICSAQIAAGSRLEFTLAVWGWKEGSRLRKLGLWWKSLPRLPDSYGLTMLVRLYG